MAGVSNTSARPFKHRINQQVGTKNLDPNEWDFRGVNPDHLNAILFYEQEREDQDLPRAMPLLTPKNRRKIFSLDTNAFAKGNLASEYLGTKSKEDYKFYCLVAVCWMCMEFPKPWMSLDIEMQNEAAARFKANKRLSGYGTVRVLSRTELATKEDREQTSRTLFPQLNEQQFDSPALHIIQIDWAIADDRALKPLLLGLLQLRPKGIHPRKISTGKRAAVPIHKLKQLAAWRLKEAGLNHREVLEAIKPRQNRYPLPECRLDLLPKYASAGAWSDAVKAGEKVIRGF